ncbi:hypothetical protein BJ878DRAFT_497129 [Calycina marina]|uniref:Uncharacterized protein n=1 Tax=Calycina marina TaxID=1763456 RepID=A0A9P7Z6G0_9HELO|nr:hypothetical protein BJ878DRAFT_497129 [Calycina marina]
MLKCIELIQQTLLSSVSVLDYLKSTMQKCFGESDIHDGYFYFPASLGGPELQNLFFKLVRLRDSVYENPELVLDGYFKTEEDDDDDDHHHFLP